ncbi:uncharacterized protein LTR77_001674 [Saxophila tyrrhenica]|uniref:Uncharacterized protein n=1 Tax=Saxophila tyrrhenica TaxID=1690608 RepID=A0AAV9PNJ7_9PEZI|nr:hypothetical protein LTR77_001674 [Saxophila tyrrhenica]
MPSSLRRRLQKRAVGSELSGASDGDDSSLNSSSSQENVKAALTRKTKVQAPIDRDDLSSTPPPPPPKSPDEMLARNISPPQSLLDRYKKRAARLPPAGNVEAPPQRQQTGMISAFGEDFETSDAHDPFDNCQSPKSSALDVQDKSETRTFGGVQFDMMRKKDRAGEAPVADPIEDGSKYERRFTRSQSRRQQRMDSAGDAAGLKDVDASKDHLAPPATTMAGGVRLVRTPSPRTSQATQEPQDQDVDELAQTPNSSPALQHSPRLPTRPLTHMKAALLPNRYSPVDPSLSPRPLNLPHRGKSNANHTRSRSITSVAVHPPVNIDMPPMFVWTSPLPTTSRPTDPWIASKRWTCCQCGPMDPDDKPAQTIVEQKEQGTRRTNDVFGCGMAE